MSHFDYLQRLGALLSALFPGVWLGLLLTYASRARMTSEAIKNASVAGMFSALTVGILLLTISAVTGDEGHIAGGGAAIRSFVTAALPEEAAKLIVLVAIVYRHEDVQSPLDRILAGGWVGLGFASLENVFYVFSHHDRWLATALIRAATAVPSHTMAGILMGALLALSKEETVNKSWWIAVAFLGPFSLHGFYNLCVHALGGNIPNALLFSENDWQPALGLSFILILEALLTILTVQHSRTRLRTFAPPARGCQERPGRVFGHFLGAVFTLTLLAATGMVCLALAGAASGRPAALGLSGAGFAWLCIAYLVRCLRHP